MQEIYILSRFFSYSQREDRCYRQPVIYKSWYILSNLSLSLYFSTFLFLYISSLWLLLRFCLPLLKVYFVYFIGSFYLCSNWKIQLIYVTVITNLFGFVLDILSSFILSSLFIFLCVYLENILFYFLYILETLISALKIT